MPSENSPVVVRRRLHLAGSGNNERCAIVAGQHRIGGRVVNEFLVGRIDRQLRAKGQLRCRQVELVVLQVLGEPPVGVLQILGAGDPLELFLDLVD